MAMDRGQCLEAELQNDFQTLDWEGQEETQEASFKIGLELDLNEGTLVVYKNDRRLGTMMSGLAGEYCWVVTFVSLTDDAMHAQVSVSIGR